MKNYKKLWSYLADKARKDTAEQAKEIEEWNEECDKFVETCLNAYSELFDYIQTRYEELPKQEQEIVETVIKNAIFYYVERISAEEYMEICEKADKDDKDNLVKDMFKNMTELDCYEKVSEFAYALYEDKIWDVMIGA